MWMRTPFRMLGLLGLLVWSAVDARAESKPFPSEIVCWAQAPEFPVFEGAGGDAWDQKIRERGWIRFEDGVYHLWYTGYNDDRSPTKFLGHATSTDGIQWTRNPDNPIFDASWVEDMCVVKHKSLYYMFAEGQDDIAHWLTSPDGLNWTAHGPLDIRKTDGTPISPGPRGTPTVWIEGDTWYLFYERGDQGIWLATSTDQQVWTNVQDDPVIGLGPEPYDVTAVALNQVFRHEGVYYGIYHANAHRPWRDWTTCIVRSKDLIHWEKYPGNPIVEDNASSGVFVFEPEGLRLFTMHPDVRRYEPAP